LRTGGFDSLPFPSIFPCTKAPSIHPPRSSHLSTDFSRSSLQSSYLPSCLPACRPLLQLGTGWAALTRLQEALGPVALLPQLELPDMSPSLLPVQVSRAGMGVDVFAV
jgi:hypothetical protein